MTVAPRPFCFDQMARAVEDVRDRLRRTTAALEAAGVLHAVVGGNAVAAHVGRADAGGVRNKPDVDVMIRREDLGRAWIALNAAGFVGRRVKGTDIFLDGRQGRPRQRVRLLFAGERVNEGDLLPHPDVAESEIIGPSRVLSLGPLVLTKLTAFRTIDRVHLQDMIGVGLIDAAWPARLPPVLGERLQTLLDDPDG